MQTERQTPVIETPGKRTLVAIARDFTMETRNQIPGLWQEWFQAGHDIPGAEPGAMYGASFMADGQGAFRYAVGVAVDPVPDTLPKGTCLVTLTDGPHAVLRAFGPMTDLPATFDWLFSDWMPASGHSPAEGAVYERYPQDPRNGPEAMAYEIWAPVSD